MTTIKREKRILIDVIDWNRYDIIKSEVSLQGKILETIIHLQNPTRILLKFLSNFGSTEPNVFDLTSDGKVNVSDLLKLLGGDQNDILTTLIEDIFSYYIEFQTFGEGNTWFEAVSSPINDVVFIWFHRTPFDEGIDFPNDGYEGLNSFVLDLIYSDNTIVKYTFVKTVN